MNIPDNNAPLKDILEFCAWNDGMGAWPELVEADDDRIMSNDDSFGFIAEAPPSSDHKYYCCEFERWYTEDELRAELIPILDECRAD